MTGPWVPAGKRCLDHRCQASGIRRGARRGPAVLTGTDTSVLLKAPTPQRSRAPCRGPWSTCSPSPVPSSAGGALRLASVARRSPWWSLRHWLCSPVVWSPGFGLLGPPTWVPPGHAWGYPRGAYRRRVRGGRRLGSVFLGGNRGSRSGTDRAPWRSMTSDTPRRFSELSLVVLVPG